MGNQLNELTRSLAFAMLLTTAASPRPALAGTAYTVPISANEITMEVRLGTTSSTAKVVSYEGALVKVGDLQRENVFGVVPLLREDGAVRLVLFRIDVADEPDETMRQLEELSVPQNAVVTFSKAPVTIEVTGVKLSLAPAPAPNKDDCCVYCDFWACAVCVYMDCGCCCDPPKTCIPYPGGP